MPGDADVHELDACVVDPGDPATVSGRPTFVGPTGGASGSPGSGEPRVGACGSGAGRRRLGHGLSPVGSGMWGRVLRVRLRGTHGLSPMRGIRGPGCRVSGGIAPASHGRPSTFERHVAGSARRDPRQVHDSSVGRSPSIAAPRRALPHGSTSGPPRGAARRLRAGAHHRSQSEHQSFAVRPPGTPRPVLPVVPGEHAAAREGFLVEVAVLAEGPAEVRRELLHGHGAGFRFRALGWSSVSHASKSSR